MAKAKTKEKDKDKPKRSETPRPKNDAYVMMLFITLLAIVGGTVLMYLDYDEYGSKNPPTVPITSPPKLGEGTKDTTTPVTPPVTPPDGKGGMGP
jgi:hypothetical protein